MFVSSDTHRGRRMILLPSRRRNHYVVSRKFLDLCLFVVDIKCAAAA
jgi:hypothetical protein